MYFINRYIFIFIISIFSSTFTYSQQNSAPPPAIDESKIKVNIPTNNTTVQTNQSQIRVKSIIQAGDYIKLVITLAIIILLIYLLLRFLRKFSVRDVQEQNNLIRVLGSRILHNNEIVHVIELEGLVYVIGSSSNQVTLLDKIEDKEIVDRLILNATNNPSESTFSRIMGKKGFFQQETTSLVNFIKKQQERLKKPSDD